MRAINVLQTNNCSSSPPFIDLHSRTNKRLFPHKFASSSILNHSLRSFRIHQFLRNPNLKVGGGRTVGSGVVKGAKVMEIEDGGLIVETCITCDLPPALTLQRGLEMITVEIEKLKSHPPCCNSGVYRFQVAVPPSPKALNWFCCQPKSSGVFPQFFISKELDNSTFKSACLKGTRQVFGVGAAVYFTRSSCTSGCFRPLLRYLSPDSRHLIAYGLLDINVKSKLSHMEKESGAFYFLIPQVEFAEHEGISILTATLVWNDVSLCTFEEAVHSFELSLQQVRHHCVPPQESFSNKCLKSILPKFNVVLDQTAPMVYMKDLSLDENSSGLDSLELFNLANKINISLRDYANVNALWAYLIVEECVRLGLTNFCVAPGSRSSPLAIAASTHPFTTCIPCFDERSLSFHALGYARGSQKPAVVITSSGTAVSNCYPAVVEASQDFVPLLVLTADRPPELHDAGANQAINQVSHFGSFVRYFFDLPVPTDKIPGRMVLTTIDSAVYHATSSPQGPVHINCPFREPLEDTPQIWTSSCLIGLDIWTSSAAPYTKYTQVVHSFNHANSLISEIVEVIQGAKQGILLIGAIHTEDKIWAALNLAKHLMWPVVADILSGLRLRKLLASSEKKEDILFVDHLDHALLSELVRNWVKPDVVVQIGSRITSKRISQMLGECSPLAYIMVDKHPYRHDPLHIVTHRVRNTITEFADCLYDAIFPTPSSKWTTFLNVVNTMVAWEMSFQICSNSALTEPYVAHILSRELSSDSALFIGNSMVIRDADMYGHNFLEENHSTHAMMLNLKLPCYGLHVAGNRGASGIDGLLSTAIGFAAGCKKRVLCLLGDVSFLHDTNGLALMNQRMWRKPMTIVVINNRGGAIFSLLPIAERVDPKIMSQFFYTSHSISVRELCVAHGVKHIQVQNKLELGDALFTSKQGDIDYVIEVDSSIDANAIFHSRLQKFACKAADNAVSILSKVLASPSVTCRPFLCKIQRMEYSLYRVLLSAPTTSTSLNTNPTKYYREGFILTIFLEDGSSGFGEVAPLDTTKENMRDIKEQIKFILHVIQRAKISCSVPLLKSSFSSWIWRSLGVPPSSIFPSVRCGLEMAILNAMAAMQGCSLLKMMHPQTNTQEATPDRVKICALLDCNGTPMEVAYAAITLVGEGFSALKIKVARREDPLEDAEVIRKVRKMVGHQTKLRADANRQWTYEQAVVFGVSVKKCDLQYIEEPVQKEEDIIRFCDETGLPVALDETIDNIQEDPLKMLAKYNHAGIVAVVIKPSVVGGLENAALIARWAQQRGKMAVISAAFESSIGLSTYIQFCCYLELQNADIHHMMNIKPISTIVHGLGTYKWLKEDVTVDSLKIGPNPNSGNVEASAADADFLLKKGQINQNIILQKSSSNQVRRYQLNVDSESFSCQIKVQETGSSTDNLVLIFVHGFLGTGEEWIPTMNGISGSARCITFDLPGHGESKIRSHASGKSGQEPMLSIEAISDILHKLITIVSPGKVVVVGYSMGARIALNMALMYRDMIEGAVIISGSPGLNDEDARRNRKDKDDTRARSLVVHGLQLFLDNWYIGPLWNSLRVHPNFKEIVASRLQHDDIKNLAKALSDSSIGRQRPLWDDLECCKTPLLLVVGEKDQKFRTIAKEMLCKLNNVSSGKNDPKKEIYKVVEVPKSGHAVHLENPLFLLSALRKFLTTLE